MMDRIHRRLRAAAIAAALAAGLAAGCGDDSIEAPRETGQAFVRPIVVDLTREGGLALIERADSVLVFNVTGRVPELRVGWIVAGGDDGGFLRRIEGVRRAGPRLYIDTGPAFVTDAVISGAADTTVGLRFGSYASAANAPPDAPLRIVEAAPGVSASPGGIDMAGVVIHEGIASGKELSIVISRGRIEYEPSLELGVDIAPGSLSGFRAVLRGPYALDFEAIIEAGGPCDFLGGATIATLERDVVMRMGRFPLVARARLRFIASAYLRGDFTGTAAFAGGAAGPLGFGAVRRGVGWTEYRNEEIAFDSPAVSLPEHHRTRITIAVYPSLEIEFYRMPTARTHCQIMMFYREWDGGAPVIEWDMLGALGGYFDFERGCLDSWSGSYRMALTGRTVILGRGPFKTERYIFTGQWGGEGTGDGRFGYPKGIAVDGEGFVYVVDNLWNRIQKFTPDGDFVSGWGSPGSGPGQLDAPEKIAIDAAGIVYVADAGNRRVQRFTRDGLFVSAWGTEGTGDGQFRYPFGVAAGGGLVFVSDNLNHRVQRFEPDGAFLSAWGSPGSGPGQFQGPMGAAYSAAGGGYLYVCDCRNNRICRFTPAGEAAGSFGTAGSGDGQFDCPTDVAVDAAGNVYVCDLGNDRIQVFSPSGAFLTKLGSTGDGEGQFDHPESIAIDGRGYLYVVDGRNHRIQMFAPLTRE